MLIPGLYSFRTPALSRVRIFFFFFIPSSLSISTGDILYLLSPSVSAVLSVPSAWIGLGSSRGPLIAPVIIYGVYSGVVYNIFPAFLPRNPEGPASRKPFTREQKELAGVRGPLSEPSRLARKNTPRWPICRDIASGEREREGGREREEYAPYLLDRARRHSYPRCV